MASRDLHHNIKVLHSIAPQSLGATAAGGKTGVVIDTNGFNAVEFSISYGAVTATNATVVPTFYEGDATGAMTPIASGSLLGSVAFATLPQGTPRASGVNSNINKRVGYIGHHRYVGMKLAPTVSGGIIAAGNVILGEPVNAPTTT